MNHIVSSKHSQTTASACCHGGCHALKSHATMIPHAAESPQPGQPTHRRTAGPTQSCSVPTRNRRRRTRSLALPGPPSPTPPSSRHQTPVQVIRSGSCKSYGKSRLSEISIHPHVPCAAGERSTSRSRGTERPAPPRPASPVQ